MNDEELHKRAKHFCFYDEESESYVFDRTGIKLFVKSIRRDLVIEISALRRMLATVADLVNRESNKNEQ